VTLRRREIGIGIALALVFVVLRTVPFALAQTGRGIDSFDYAAASRLSVFSREFLAGARPFGYPLYMKIVRHNDTAIVVGQLVVSTTAWLLLALMVARATRRPGLRIAGAALVLALGATFEAIEWDRIISSESLSTAFGVGLLAAVLWLRERWSWPRLALVATLALAATAVRDSNGSFLGVVAIVLAITVAVAKLPPRVLLVSLAFVLAAAMGSLSASGGRRWEGPLKDVITIRILHSPERTGYFEAHGLPLTDAEFYAARGRCVSPAPPTACVVIANDAFYRWIRENGRTTYLKSLIKFPATTLWEPVAHLRDSIGTRVRVEMKLAADTEEESPISRFLEAFVFVRNPLLVALAGLAILGGCVVALLKGRRGAFVVAAALLALTYPHLWLVWTGGALEVSRHSLLASFQLRLGIVLGAVWLLDAARMRPSEETEALAHGEG
jgi:hypothetical protein